MANKYGILADIERKIRERDTVCIYCNKKMIKGHRKSGPTIEHLNNIHHYYNPASLTESDLGICCHSCNTSRGAKHYWNWFESEYCLKRKINKKTVAKVVREYIKKYPTIRKFKKRSSRVD